MEVLFRTKCSSPGNQTSRQGAQWPGSSQNLVCHYARGKVPAGFLSLFSTLSVSTRIGNARKNQASGDYIFCGCVGPGHLNRCC